MVEPTRKMVSIFFSSGVGRSPAADAAQGGQGRDTAANCGAQRAWVEKYRGVWIGEVGGGALSTFDTATGAVGCGLEMLRVSTHDGKPDLRIGIHIGELTFRETQRGTEVFGDPIVVAARLRDFAESGGICISSRVHQNLPRDQEGLKFEFLGEKKLKSVNRPVPVYRVVDPERAPIDVLDLEKNRANDARSRWFLPLASAAVAAVLAVVAAYWVSRSESLRPVSESEPARVERVAAAKQQPALPHIAAFAAVRDELLTLSGTELSARVWTIPDPVKNGALYQVEFEADCDCTVLLFAVNGMKEEIALLYPNNFEPRARITRGVTVRISSSPEWRLRAVGREGIDVLKLIAVEQPPGFPMDRSKPWVVRPDQADRVDELSRLLERVQAGAWGAATAPLQIVP